MTLAEVAEIMGTNFATISKYELGLIPYTQRVVQKLAEIYGARPGDLLNGPPVDASSPVSDLRALPSEMQNEILDMLQGMLSKAKRIK